MKKSNFSFSMNMIKGSLMLALIFVFGLRASAQLSCIGHVNVSLDNACSATLTPLMFESQGLGDYAVWSTTLAGVQAIAGPTALNTTVSSAQCGQTLYYKVVLGTNACWGTFKVEDKIAPAIACTPTTVICPVASTIVDLFDGGPLSGSSLPASLTSLVPAPSLTVPTCGNVNWTVSLVSEIGDPCAGEVVLRYRLTEACSGMYAECDQVITVEAIDFATDFDEDAQLDLTFVCGEAPFATAADYTPAALAGLAAYVRDIDNDIANENAWPSIIGIDIDPTICSLAATWSDQVIQLCGESTFKILRTWSVIDWCSGEVVTYIQIIKVMDNVAPEVGVVTATYTDDYYRCGQTINFCVEAEDNCSDASQLTGTYTFTQLTQSECVQPGVNVPATITYSGVLGSELCASAFLPVGTYSLTVTVKDGCNNGSGPVTREETFVIRDNVRPVPVCDEVTQVSLTNNCVSRVYATTFDDGSTDNCEVVSFKVRRMTAHPSNFNTTYNGLETLSSTFSDYIDFDNTDLGATEGDNINATTCGRRIIILRVFDCYGNWNDCMVQALIDDKIKPVVVPAANRVICCDAPEAWDINSLFSATFADNCAVSSNSSTNNETPYNCNRVYTRTWTVTDRCGNSSQGSQVITVLHNSDYTVNYPADITLECVNDSSLTNPVAGSTSGYPVISDDECEMVAISRTDEIFYQVPDACYKIIRKWNVINWCTYNENESITFNDDYISPNHLTHIDGGASGIGYEFQGYELSPIDNRRLCQGSGDGYSTHTQIIKVRDSVAPVAGECTASSSLSGTGAQSNPFIFNVDQTDCILPNETTERTCTGTANVTVNFTDACTNGVGLKYHYKLYSINAAGVETLVYTSGYSSSNNHIVYPSLAVGNYKVRFFAEDGCTNFVQKDCYFNIRDKKKPTPVCYGSISFDVMPTTGMVTLWASDFEAGSSCDNCATRSWLVYRIRLAGTGTGVPSSSSVVFDCNQIPLGPNTVELWVGDKGYDENHNDIIEDSERNWDFCTSIAIVQNNMNASCSTGSESRVAGTIKTESGANVENVTVNVNNATSTYLTGLQGYYEFLGLQAGGSYTVAPQKDINPLNGVTTLDLVLISKHILGIQSLGTPYKMIAADVNNSESITTLDLVELRKLILNIIPDFTNSTSWKFVDKNYQFTTNNPLTEAYPQSYNITSLNANMNIDFIGVKVGDVNGTAQANSLATGENRSAGDFNINAEETTLSAGETKEVSFSADMTEVAGYQFTMSFGNGVEVMDVKAGEGVTAENFGMTSINEGIITTSVDNATANKAAKFTVVLKAKEDVKLSEVVSINSRITKAEAYNNNLDRMNVGINFRGAVSGYALYQNNPNPFKGETVIGFNLPSAERATLKVMDITGKVIKVVEGNFSKGYNEVKLNRNDVAVGTLVYELSTADFTATKRMVVVE